MTQRIFTSGPLTNDQIRAAYDRAAELKVWIRPWDEGRAVDGSTFKWGVQGGVFAVRKMLEFLRSMD